MSNAATRPVVLLAEKLAPSAVALLGGDVEIRHVDGTDRPALLAAIADADALLVRSATKVDAEALAAALLDLRAVAASHAGRYARFVERWCALEDGRASERVLDAVWPT